MWNALVPTQDGQPAHAVQTGPMQIFGPVQIMGPIKMMPAAHIAEPGQIIGGLPAAQMLQAQR